MFAALFALLLAAPGFEYSVASGTGLSIHAGGVPFVRGSWFQYYEPGWSKGYYSSTYQSQTVTKNADGSVNVSFQSEDGLVSGHQLYRQVGNTLTVSDHFEWAGDHPVLIEMTPGMIWAPAVEAGSGLLDGVPSRDLRAVDYHTQDISKRQFGPNARHIRLTSPAGSLNLKSNQQLLFFDGRGSDQGWADGKSLLWAGAESIEVAKGKPVDLQFEWTVTGPEAVPSAPTLIDGHSTKGIVEAPDERLPILIPKPKIDRLNFGQPMAVTGKYSFPAGRFKFFNLFREGLARKFRLPQPTAKDATVAADGGVSKLGFTPGGYRITVTPNQITVLGEEDEGLQNGLNRLVQLAFLKDGRIVLPTGTLIDEPQNKWRGVHLFVGPKAVAFHKRLWERVLRPLGFNKVVLQCERTDWKSVPGIKTDITMPLPELKRLFAMYRELGVEPIPLIQSFGHMEWAFARDQNLNLAFNPKVPYALDPRKPESAVFLNKLWDEAISELKPETVHFGCDEVDMRGFPNDPSLVTDLWKLQMPILGDIAKKHGVKSMIWGDMALHPSEAIDAANAPTLAIAAERRAAIPKSMLIADWHYKGEPDPHPFMKSLQTWRKDDFTPIATAWYNPANVRGFNLAAYLEQSGTLQSTWCGYESQEGVIQEAFNQFSAMVLAADYSWSARQEPLDKLGYDPGEVLRRMYFDDPAPVSATRGIQTWFGGTPAEITIGGNRFMAGTSLKLRSVLSKDGSGQPESVTVGLGGVKGSTLSLALTTQVKADDGETVADVTVELASGRKILVPIVYGREVRARSDSGICTLVVRDGGLSAVKIRLGSVPVGVKSITFHAQNPYAGLEIAAVSVK